METHEEIKIKIRYLLQSKSIKESVDKVSFVPVLESNMDSDHKEYLVRTDQENILLVYRDDNGDFQIDKNGKHLNECIKLYEKVLADSKQMLESFNKHNRK